MCGRRPVGRPGSGRVDLDEPGGTALAYQPVLAEGDSGNRDFHSSRTLLGSISSGHALISPVAVQHMLQVLEQLAEVKSRFGQWATGYRDALPQNYVAYGLNGTCTLRL